MKCLLIGLIVLGATPAFAQTVKDGVRTDSLVDMSSDKASSESLIGPSTPKSSPVSVEDTERHLMETAAAGSKSSALSELVQLAYSHPENIEDWVSIWNHIDGTYGPAYDPTLTDDNDPCNAVVSLYLGRAVSTSETAIELSSAVQNFYSKIFGFQLDSMPCRTINGTRVSLGSTLLEWVRLLNFKPLGEDQLRRAGLQDYVDELHNALGENDIVMSLTKSQETTRRIDPLEVPRLETCGWQDRDDDEELTKSRNGRSVQKGIYECGCTPETRALSALALKKQTSETISDYLKNVNRPVFTTLLFQNILHKSSCRQYFFLWDDKGLALIKKNMARSPLIKWMIEATKEMELRRDR